MSNAEGMQRCICGKSWAFSGGGIKGSGRMESHGPHQCTETVTTYPLAELLHKIGYALVRLGNRIPARDKPLVLSDVRACAHCRLPKRDHVSGKCLFDATTYTPMSDEQIESYFTKKAVKGDAVTKATEELLTQMSKASP